MSEKLIKLNQKLSLDLSKVLNSKDSKKWQSLAKVEGPYSRPMPTPPSCAVCKSGVNKTACPKCFAVFYCGNKCWNQDKAKHQKTCGREVVCKLVQDEESDYHYVFNKNVTTGSFILEDDIPVIMPVLPREYLDDDKSLHAGLIVCLGCHVHFYASKSSGNCAGCGMPLCRDCILNSCVHHQSDECEILKIAYGKNFGKIISAPRKYVELLLDVCLLRVLRSFFGAETNAFAAERYRKFMLLRNTPRFRKFTKVKTDAYDGTAYWQLMKNVEKQFPMSLAYAHYNRELVQQAYRIMTVFWETRETRPSMSRVLFLDRHFMKQSYCSANVSSTVTYDPKRNNWPVWVTYMTRDVGVAHGGGSGNEKFPVFDSSPHRFMPLPMRLLYFMDNGIPYYCRQSTTCCVCKHSNDGGCHTGSIRCCSGIQCKGLYEECAVWAQQVLLDKPTIPRWSSEYLEKVKWVCNQCGHRVPAAMILEVNQYLEKIYLDEVRYRKGANLLVDVPEFLEYCDKLVHPMNGVALRAMWDFLVAAREKQYYETKVNWTGRPLDPYDEEKKMLMLIPEEGKLKAKLFPEHWDEDEMQLTHLRNQYVTCCFTFAENVRVQNLGRAASENYTEFVFINVEHVVTNLILSCMLYANHRDISSAEGFVDVARATVKTCEDFERKGIKRLGIDMLATDPLLKGVEELNGFAEICRQHEYNLEAMVNHIFSWMNYEAKLNSEEKSQVDMSVKAESQKEDSDAEEPHFDALIDFGL